MSLTKVQINLGTSGNLSGSRSLASSSLASRITTAEDELGNTLISSSAQLADDISGSFGSQRVGTSDSPTFNAITVGTATITGTLTAQEVHSEFESASILFTSGSTHFGNSSDDVHEMTGSLNISGSLSVKDGTLTVTDNVDFNGNLDVDGTTNLDNTDIDGTLTVDGGNIVFNEDSADQDFRVESNDNTHMFFVDGGNNRIGIGVGATPAFATLDIDAPGATNADNLDQSVDRATLRVRYRTDETDDGMFFGGLGSSAGYIQGVIDASNDNTSQAGKTIAINPYGGNVGIGTNNVSELLHLYSTSANTPNILIQNENDSAGESGAAGGIEFYLKDDNGSNPDFQDLGIIRWTGHDKDNPYNKFTAAAITGSADDPGNSSGRIDLNVAYSDSMIDAMTIRAVSAGKSRVGIGSTAPAGTIDVFGDDGYAYFTTTSPQAFNMIFRSGSADPQNNWLGQIEFTGQPGSTSQIVTRNSRTLALGSNNVQTLFITDNDYVGIGVSDPDRLLELESTGDCWIKVGSTAGTDRAFLVGTDSNHKFQVYDETAGAMRFTIADDGDVGIGTDNPNSLLTVFGDNKHLEVRSADYSLALIGAAGSSGAGLDRGIVILYEDGNTNVELLGEGSLMLDDRGDSVKNLLMKATGAIDHGMTNYDDGDIWHKVTRASNEGGVQFVGYSERKIGIEMVCRYNGDENSSYDSSGQSTSTQAPINIVVQRANGTSIAAVPADKNLLSLRNNTTTRFIFNSNGTAYAGDSWTTISDKRVKKDIKDIPYGLDEINKLEPKIFTRYDGDFDDEGNVVLDGDGKKQIGFIAQEIKEVVPEMIANQNQDLTEGFYVMDDGKLTSVLVKAVQELSQKNEALEKRIEELEK